MTIARRERQALADLLEQLGPDAPTLCAGWDTRALAAHLASRERRPDATPGIAIPVFAGWTEHVQRAYETKPYAELVELVRSGPGRLSPFALPGAESFFNTTEYVVHHEDVRRAQPDWQPRDLPQPVQDALWRAVRTRAPLAFRKLEAGAVLARSDGREQTYVAKKGEHTVTITGEPLELLLYLFGRRDHARVDISGSDTAIAALSQANMSV